MLIFDYIYIYILYLTLSLSQYIYMYIVKVISLTQAVNTQKMISSCVTYLCFLSVNAHSVLTSNRQQKKKSGKIKITRGSSGEFMQNRLIPSGKMAAVFL